MEDDFRLFVGWPHADDHTSHPRVPLRVVRPLEGLMGKANFQAAVQNVGPEQRDLFALANRICAYK